MDTNTSRRWVLSRRAYGDNFDFAEVVEGPHSRHIQKDLQTWGQAPDHGRAVDQFVDVWIAICGFDRWLSNGVPLMDGLRWSLLSCIPIRVQIERLILRSATDDEIWLSKSSFMRSNTRNSTARQTAPLFLQRICRWDELGLLPYSWMLSCFQLGMFQRMFGHLISSCKCYADTGLTRLKILSDYALKRSRYPPELLSRNLVDHERTLWKRWNSPSSQYRKAIQCYQDLYYLWLDSHHPTWITQNQHVWEGNETSQTGLFPRNSCIFMEDWRYCAQEGWSWTKTAQDSLVPMMIILLFNPFFQFSYWHIFDPFRIPLLYTQVVRNELHLIYHIWRRRYRTGRSGRIERAWRPHIQPGEAMSCDQLEWRNISGRSTPMRDLLQPSRTESSRYRHYLDIVGNIPLLRLLNNAPMDGIGWRWRSM